MSQLFCQKVGTTLAQADGQVLSLNPSSNAPPYGPYHFGLRPSGTNGPYEQVDIGGNIATYNPTGHEAVRFIISSVPNAAMPLAMDQEPLK